MGSLAKNYTCVEVRQNPLSLEPNNGYRNYEKYFKPIFKSRHSKLEVLGWILNEPFSVGENK